jgi:hypothetical protein
MELIDTETQKRQGLKMDYKETYKHIGLMIPSEIKAVSRSSPNYPFHGQHLVQLYR